MNAASRGFAPVCAPDAQVLILGSLPGRLSLEQRRYYASPANSFWRIMESLAITAPDASYDLRLSSLIQRRIALWDVCEEASRPGSLDSAIDARSVRANDFRAFLERHEAVRLICFNGSTAQALFLKHALPALRTTDREIVRRRLPSTSPAHAAMRFQQKLALWREALEPFLAPQAGSVSG